MQKMLRTGLQIVLVLGLSVPAAFSQSQQTADPKAPNAQATSPAVEVAQLQGAQVGPTDAAGQLQNVQAPVQNMPTDLHRAYDTLQDARNLLGQAGGEWGGHKANAVAAIDEAMKQLRQAVEWAKTHGSNY